MSDPYIKSRIILKNSEKYNPKQAKCDITHDSAGTHTRSRTVLANIMFPWSCRVGLLRFPILQNKLHSTKAFIITPGIARIAKIIARIWNCKIIKIKIVTVIDCCSYFINEIPAIYLRKYELSKIKQIIHTQLKWPNFIFVSLTLLLYAI